MLDFLSFNILSVLFVFCTVVIVHELGHFLMAKLLKIRVEAFAVGFGPRILGFRKGETEYKICAIPLGGYVKMAGENPGDSLTGGIEEFLSRPKWQRFLVALMGPVMNVMLALLLLAGLFYYKFEVPASRNEPVVVGLISTGSPAEKAGIRPHDRIVRVGKKSNPTWDQLLIEVATSANHPLEFEIDRPDGRIVTTITPEARGREQAGYLGISPYLASLAIIKNVTPGKPAAQAGLLPGDKIIRIAGIDLEQSGKDLVDVLQNTRTEQLTVVVLRHGQEMSFQVHPYQDKSSNRRMIGIERELSEKMVVKNLSLGEAFLESWRQNKEFAQLIVEILRKLFQQEVSIRMLEGPVGIARQSGMAARSGFTSLLFLMAAISLNLGIFNLLPIPIMDGGVIAILLIEGLVRRDLSLKWRERITQVSVVLLLMLAMVVTYNDLIKLLPASVGKYFP
jgi:regulator of sigma E protease